MRLVALFCAIALFANAANTDEWENLRTLQSGDRVRIVTREGREVRGPLARVTDEAISIREGAGEAGVARADVRFVQTREKNHRLRNLLIGAGAGVAVGAVLDGTLGTRLRNEGSTESIRALWWVVPIGLGAGLGALSAGHPVVYRSTR